MNPDEMMSREKVEVPPMSPMPMNEMPMDPMGMMPMDQMAMPMPMDQMPMPMDQMPMPMDQMPMMPPESDMMPMDPMAEMPPEAKEALMQPDPEITTVLMARLANLDRSELQELDKIITPEVAPIVLRLLPEMGQLFNAMEQEGFMEMREVDDESPAEEELGALGNV